MVCAALARERGYSVIALSVDYGQRHRVELEAREAVLLSPIWLTPAAVPALAAVLFG